jgi:hypothetical protein
MLNKTPFEDVFDSKMLFRHPSRCKIKVTSSESEVSNQTLISLSRHVPGRRQSLILKQREAGS